MKTVELVPGIKSSALGFGCAPILGAVGAAQAKNAISIAIDEGVTHFDLARSYGFGDAEALVGRVLGSQRDKFVIATKFGIGVTPLARFLKPLKPLVRLARRGGRASHSSSPALGGRFHRSIALNSRAMRRSLETSLKALDTDYVDYLFIHDPSERVSEFDSIAEEAVRLKEEGKIRAWGLACGREKLTIHKEILDRVDILQFDLAPGGAGYGEICKSWGARSAIFFSPFRGAPAFLPRDEVLRKLSTDFPKSVILCSMFNESHIRSNARALT